MDGYKTTDRDIQQIQYTRLVEMLEDAEGGYTVIVDVRSASKFVQDHIPGAIHIPFPQLKANDARLSDADHIVVYGDGREDYLSPAAAKRLLNLGYGHVLDFRDGLVMWNNHRQPSP